MRDRYAAAVEYRGDDRRAHPRAFGTRLRRLVDALVRGGDLLLQQQRGVREPRVNVDLRKIAAGHELGHQAFLDHADGDAARDFAGVVATHAVGEHGEARAVDEYRVFVVGANHSRMGQVRDG
jgi:hypothetical protein